LCEALDYFERALGSEWPGWTEGRPLANTFFTGVNGDEVAGVELYRALRALPGDLEIGEVIGQLQSTSWEQFVAATMVLEVASRACRARIPTTLLRARGKTIADLQLNIAARWLTIECVALHETAVMRHADDVYINLAQWLAESGIDRLGRTTIMILNERAPTEVLNRLPELQTAVQSLVRDERPEVEIEEFAKISFERGLAPLPVAIAGLGGEPADRDVQRLRHRMRQKSCQLAVDGPSLLLVRSRYLFAFDHLRGEMVARAVAMLDEELERLHDISAVLLYETWLGSPPPRIRHRGGPVSILAGADGRGRSRVALLVASANAAKPIAEAELDAFAAEDGFW